MARRTATRLPRTIHGLREQGRLFFSAQIAGGSDVCIPEVKAGSERAATGAQGWARKT